MGNYETTCETTGSGVDIRRHKFPTREEANAFLAGVEFVCDPAIEARIEDAEPCVVITEDRSDADEEEE